MNTWICPICQRNFSRKNQSHSCDTYSIEDHHLSKAEPETRKIYQNLINYVGTLGQFSIESMKTMILLKENTQFLSIAVQKNALKITFRLFTEVKSIRFHDQSQQKDMFYVFLFDIS